MSCAVAPLAVLQLTDTHFLAEAHHEMLGINTEKYFTEVLAHAFAGGQHYDVVVLTGDLAQDPCPKSYQRLRDYLVPLNLPIISLPGNHDDFEIMQLFLNEHTLSCQKQHLFDHWQIIALNSQIPGEPGGYLAASELTFLRQALRDYPHHQMLIAVHHHCTPANSAWIDSMIISNHAELLTLLQDYPNAKAIISGHIHQALEQHINHLQLLSTPSTCFQFTPNSHHFSICKTAPGYRKLLLYPDGTLTTSVKRIPGELEELNIDGHGYID